MHVAVSFHSEQQGIHPSVVARMTSIVDEPSRSEPQSLRPGPRWHEHEILRTVHIKCKASYDRVLAVLQGDDVMNLNQSAEAEAYPRSSEGPLS